MANVGTFAPGTGGILDVVIGFPAAGAEWSYTVPARVRLRLLYGRATLVTSFTVGIRRAQVKITTPAGILYMTSNYGALGGGLTHTLAIRPCPDANNAIGAFDFLQAMPLDTILVAGDIIASQTAVFQPDDQYGPILLRFEEWTEV